MSGFAGASGQQECESGAASAALARASGAAESASRSAATTAREIELGSTRIRFG